ncbi:exosortase family protein XrtF [Flavobacterium sp.]|uniref:exosortase family protein XrtF n=1 Tax=Flavobacterium sp. TaxID=239 RepID=UPI00375396A6
MKEYFKEFKPFLLFLAKFFGTYLVLTFAYQTYLSEFDQKKFEVDGFTKIVAHQTMQFTALFDCEAYKMPNLKEPSINLFYKKKWVSRIIEGCNALSIMILFVSFVFAFTGKLKQTLLFIVFGCIVIHLFNIIRIALLGMSLYHYPKYQAILHDVFFPLFIYGVVFILWIVWVNKFSDYAKKSS